MSGPIILTAWRGGTFGLRVRVADRCRFAGRHKVEIILPRIRRPSQRLTANITPSFWGIYPKSRICPEFRSAVIGKWLKECNLFPWPGGWPPKFEAKVSGLGEVVEIMERVPDGPAG